MRPQAYARQPLTHLVSVSQPVLGWRNATLRRDARKDFSAGVSIQRSVRLSPSMLTTMPSHQPGPQTSGCAASTTVPTSIFAQNVSAVLTPSGVKVSATRPAAHLAAAAAAPVPSVPPHTLN